MPKPSVTFAESAMADPGESRNWYAEQGVTDAGNQFVTEIPARIEALRHHPQLGPTVTEFEQSSLRELLHPPFRIVCRREPEHVRIARCWRSERLLALPKGEEA